MSDKRFVAIMNTLWASSSASLGERPARRSTRHPNAWCALRNASTPLRAGTAVVPSAVACACPGGETTEPLSPADRVWIEPATKISVQKPAPSTSATPALKYGTRFFFRQKTAYEMEL